MKVAYMMAGLHVCNRREDFKDVKEG